MRGDGLRRRVTPAPRLALLALALLALALLGTSCTRSPSSGLPPGVKLLGPAEEFPNDVRLLMSLLEKGFSARVGDALAQKTGLSGLHGAADDEALSHPLARAGHATLGRAASGLHSARIAPPRWVVTAIEAMATRRPHVGGERLVVELKEGRAGHLEAIATGESCVACHGDDARLHPAVRRWIELRYPADKSGAFRLPRLRGWFWVECDEARPR